MALQMAMPYLLRAKVSKIKPMLDAWADARATFRRAALDNEVTLQESDEVSEKIIKAMQITIDVIRNR